MGENMTWPYESLYLLFFFLQPAVSAEKLKRM